MWILGEGRNADKKKLISVPDRSAKTLIKIVLAHVHRDLIIVIDEWKGYNRLRNNDEHYTVNHNKNYVDP